MAGPRNGMNLAHRGRAVHGFAAALPLAAAVLAQPVMAQQPVSGQTNAPSSANEAPLPAPIGSDQAPAAVPEPAQAPVPSETLAPAAQAEPRVLISEVVVKGIEGHPERERLELAVYDAMATRPGARVTRSELQDDLSAIYATGWFSDVRIQPVDSPLGVQVVVTVAPNPVLTKVELDGVGAKTKLPPNLIPDIFAADYGKTLNLNSLQTRIAELQKWYADQG